jgi:cell division initiation protein
MRLSALDIKKKEFQQKMRGADPDEVQAFLNEVSTEVETLAREKNEIETKFRETSDRLANYLGLESQLEKTLVAAQQTAMKMEEQAKREAELILRDAQLERSRTLAEGRMEQERLERELLRIRSEYESTLARMKSTVAGFNAFIASFETEHQPAAAATGSVMMPAPVVMPAPPTFPSPIPSPSPVIMPAPEGLPTGSSELPAPHTNGVQWSSTGATPEPPAL